MAILEVKDLKKSFGDAEVLKGISFSLEEKNVLAIIGSSGSGKTTLLRCINMLETADSGSITVDGGVVFDGSNTDKLSAQQQRENQLKIGLVFQSFNLFPQYTALENVTLAAKIHAKSRPDFKKNRKAIFAEIDENGKALLRKVGLGEKMNNYPCELSGGQQQRVAIARSLVNEPEILLLDEPLGALDLKLRKEMQLELKRLQREMNITFIYVTHDQEEALTMSDTVVVMNGGKVQQIGTPEDIYNEPKNAFVADFIGDSNIVDGVMHRDFLVSFSGVQFPCVDRGFAREQSVQVVVRPEDIEVVSPVEGQLVGVVNDVIFKGVHFEMHVECEGREWLIHSTRACTPGETIGMRIGPNEIHIMARSEG